MRDINIKFCTQFYVTTFQPELHDLTDEELYVLSHMLYTTRKAVEDILEERILDEYKKKSSKKS